MKLGYSLVVIGCMAALGVLVGIVSGGYAYFNGIEVSILIIPAVTTVFWLFIALPCLLIGLKRIKNKVEQVNTEESSRG